MSATNQQVVTEAFQLIGVVDETQAPTATQSSNALTVLNDYLLSENVDGLRLGWYTQTNLANTAPLRDEDIWGVKRLLAKQLAVAYGVKELSPQLQEEIMKAERVLLKRSRLLIEADFSELSRPQGGPWGGPNWI